MSATATRPRLGFLGVGWIGRSRLDAIRDADVAEIAGIADPVLEDAVDLDELDLDGVVIATPSALHAEQAVAALEAGVAVSARSRSAGTRQRRARSSTRRATPTGCSASTSRTATRAR